MSSVLRSVRKRKKGRTLGAVDVIDREGYAELEVDAKVELIRSLIPLGLMHIEELLDEEGTALAGERDARKDPSVGGCRHGSNPGTVGLAGQRVPIRVPRIRHVTEREIPLRSYEALHGDRAVNDLLLRRVLYGNLVPQRRGGRRGDSRGDRPVGVDGVPRVHSGQRDDTPRTPGAGPLRGGRCGPRGWTARPSPRRRWSSALGITMTGDKRFPGLCRDGHRERAGGDPVPPVLGRAGPRCFPGAAGDRRWRQGAPGGRAARLPPPRPGATVSMAHARERGE